MADKKSRETEIRNVACRVFRKRGYHQARMAEIASEAGISYGLVYHYYKTKADLFDAIIQQWWDGLYRMMEPLLYQDAPIEEKLGTIIQYQLDQYEENPDLVHLFIAEVSRSTANLTPERLEAFKIWISNTEKMIYQAQKGGTLRKDIKARYLSTFFLGALETILSTMVLDNQKLAGKKQKERIRKNLLEQFFSGARLRT